MTRPTLEQTWSVPVALHDISETGRHFALVADERTRAAVAGIAGVVGLPRLEATFEVTRHKRDGLHVVGQVSATVSQTCVVTLEPVENHVAEPIDLVFLTDAAPALVEAQAGAEVEVPDEDGPEPLVGGIVDLGAVAVEFLMLGIDPYPRKPGSV